MASTVMIDHNYYSKEPPLEEGQVNTEISNTAKIYLEKRMRRIASYKRQLDMETELTVFGDSQISKLKTEIFEMKKKANIKPTSLEEARLFLWEFD